MVHISSVTAGRPVRVPDKAIDAGGALFFQVWLAVFTWILTGAFSSKR